MRRLARARRRPWFVFWIAYTCVQNMTKELWLARPRYNQATVALDSFVDGAAFAACPMTPPAPLRAGAQRKLVSCLAGYSSW